MTSTQPHGLAAFDRLRAEDEPWLMDCYVPPTEFSLLVGPCSTLVFGEMGSGKSGLRMALTRTWEKADTGIEWLLAQWPIYFLSGGAQNQSGSKLVDHLQTQVLDVVARALLQRLGRQTGLWTNAPEWTQCTLGWFISRHFQGDLSTHVDALITDPLTCAPSALRELANGKWPEVLARNVSPKLVISELAYVLAQLGFHGVRVIVEDVEPWLEKYPSDLTDGLFAFLSTLSLFEQSTFTYIMFLPAEMAPIFLKAASLRRYRVKIFKLGWKEPELRTMIERRMALAFDKPGFVLSDLGPANALGTWLARCGGDSPRGWLETIQPFAAAFEGTGRRQLSPQECVDVQRNHPPLLVFDHTTGQVMVGWRRLDGLSAGYLAMLRHLYENMGQVCSRKELYRVYIEANGEQIEPDAKPSDYAGILDSAILRLRKLVEPNPPPQEPILLETRKGQGLMLRTL